MGTIYQYIWSALYILFTFNATFARNIPTRSRYQITSGSDEIADATVTFDGNFKATISMETATPSTWVRNFKAGICDAYHAGVSIQGQGTNQLVIEIDMSYCHSELESCNNQANRHTIEWYNKLSIVTFSFGTWREDPNPSSGYEFEIGGSYTHLYLLNYDCSSGARSQDPAVSSFQWALMPFQSAAYETPNPSLKCNLDAGEVNMELCPANGINIHEFIHLPQKCVVWTSDPGNSAHVNEYVMWDMVLPNYDCHETVKFLTHVPSEGVWRLDLNYREMFGSQVDDWAGKNVGLACAVEVCSSGYGNDCRAKMGECDYTNIE